VIKKCSTFTKLLQKDEYDGKEVREMKDYLSSLPPSDIGTVVYEKLWKISVLNIPKQHTKKWLVMYMNLDREYRLTTEYYDSLIDFKNDMKKNNKCFMNAHFYLESMREFKV
jgi:hypothetical protein